jgi:hypothetical protein
MADGFPHAEAVLDYLNADPDITAYLGKRDGDAPCVVIYPDPGMDESSSLIPNQDVVVYVPLHAIGLGPEQALWLMDKVRARLSRATPVVTGRSVHPMWQEQAPRPLDRDDDVQPPLYSSFAEYGIRSSPA